MPSAPVPRRQFGVAQGLSGHSRPAAERSTIGGKRLSGQNGTMLEGGSRVPLIASQPGTVPAGKVNSDLIDFSDFYPAFCVLAGAMLPDGVPIDGRSSAPQLRGQQGAPREWVYVELNGRRYVRTNRWKLTGTGELFDMREAPFNEIPAPAQGQDAAADAARTHLHQVLVDLVGEATLNQPPPVRSQGGGGRRRRIQKRQRGTQA